MTTVEAESKLEASEQTVLLVHSQSDSTSAVLIKPVSGRYQFVAGALVPASHLEPQGSVLFSVTEAIEAVERQTGHKLINDDGDLILDVRQSNRGVHFLGMTAAAFSPLRVVLLSDTPDQPALHTARRLITSMGGLVVGEWAANTTRSWQEQLDKFLGFAPDLVCLVGGDGRRAAAAYRDLAARLRFALLQFSETRMAPVIFAGRPALEKAVSEGLGDGFDFYVVPDIRPQKNKERPEPLRQLLISLEIEVKMKRNPGMPEAERWASTPIVNTWSAWSTFTTYRSRVMGGPVLLIHLSDDSLALLMAEDGRVKTALRRDFGLGRVMDHLPDRIPIEQILQWVQGDEPGDLEGDLRSLLREQAIFPGTVPLQKRDGMLWEAAVKGMLAQALGDARQSWGEEAGSVFELKELIVGGSLLRYVPDDRRCFRILLDGLAPMGTFPIILDRLNLVPALGLLAVENSLAAAQVDQSAAIAPAGWAVCPTGSVRPGKTAVTVKIGDGAEKSFPWGGLLPYELPAGDPAPVTIKPGRGANAGSGRGKRWQLPRRSSVESDRLVIDTRGRPLVLPAAAKDRHLLLVQWERELGGS